MRATYNHYSIGNVGNHIIIGAYALLKAGLSRDEALNLIAWLSVAGRLTADDVVIAIQDAYGKEGLTMNSSNAEPIDTIPDGKPIKRMFVTMDKHGRTTVQHQTPPTLIEALPKPAASQLQMFPAEQLQMFPAEELARNWEGKNHG